MPPPLLGSGEVWNGFAPVCLSLYLASRSEKQEIQTLESASGIRAIWLISDGEGERDLFMLHSALAQYSVRPERDLFWDAGEGALAREVYGCVKERGHPEEWPKQQDTGSAILKRCYDHT